MSNRNTYYTLIGSLPALPIHFEQSERVPISRTALAERLKMLEPDDRKVVDDLEDFLRWERQPLERTDKEFLNRYDSFLSSVNYPFVEDLIRYAVSVRTVIAALRNRRLGEDRSAGMDPLIQQIQRNWNQPGFRLEHEFPWLLDIDSELNGVNPLDLEKRILNIVWKQVTRLSEQFHFSFEAVILYLIRWEIVYRWTSRDPDVGKDVFENMVTEALGEFAVIWKDDLPHHQNTRADS